MQQPELFAHPGQVAPLLTFLREVLDTGALPSADELVRAAVRQFGPGVRDAFPAALGALCDDPALTRARRDYIRAMLTLGATSAWHREPTPALEAASTIDALMRQSATYRGDAEFRELMAFMARFTAYSPYNLMLIRLQNPSCQYFATERDWRTRHGRIVDVDARPMLILAPRTPIVLVYDLDQTSGTKPLPHVLRAFARFSGPWKPEWMETLLENASRHAIDVTFKPLSSTLGGFATTGAGPGAKARVVVHAGLDGPSRFGVLTHELAHVLLGHLGSDTDRWWPSRAALDHAAEEIEAEAVAYLVTRRFGLMGASAAYLSGYVREGRIPRAASIDLIAKVAGKIERMARAALPTPRSRRAGAT